MYEPKALAPSSVFTKKDSSKKYSKIDHAKADAVVLLLNAKTEEEKQSILDNFIVENPEADKVLDELLVTTSDKKIDIEKAKAQGIKALKEGMQLQEE